MTYFTKSRSPKGTRASMLLTEMQRSARRTSYICSSRTRLHASFRNASAEGAKSVYLYPNNSSEISPVSRTRTSEISCIFLQTRYMPTEARTVVMSKVPVAAMT